VSKRRKAAKAVPKIPAPKMAGTPATALVPASLPPQAMTATPPAPTLKRDTTVLPPKSLIRLRVLEIIKGRIEGKTNDEIAQALGVKPATVRQYMFLAGKNGWLKKHAVDPADRLEHEIAHKVVRNLDEMLDSGDESRRDQATLKVADGMLFKKFAADAQQAPPLAVIGIRIEMPAAPLTIREGTTGGAPRFVEAEVVNGDST
jgi:hypothetical protein